VKRASRHPIWNWVIHTPWVLGVIALLSLIIFFGSGAGNPLLKRLVTARLESMTGAKVEIDSLSVEWLKLRLTLNGIVLHGTEPSNAEPLFSAGKIDLELRIDSFWGRKVSLDELSLWKPRVHFFLGSDGRSNLPVRPRQSPSASSLDSFFALQLQRVQLDEGWLFYNDTSTPISLQGGELSLDLDRGRSTAVDLYVGTLSWNSVKLGSRGMLPVPVNMSLKFTVGRDQFTMEQGVFNAAHSRIDTHFEVHKFADPEITFRYRGWIDLLDFRETFREPKIPTGKVEVRGEGNYAHHRILGSGSYSGTQIDLPYEQFHANGLVSRGSYTLDNSGMEIPDFFAGAFGGTVTGRVSIRFQGARFRAETHVEMVQLARVLEAAEEPGFPVDELHWDSLLRAETVETWSANFQKFEITGSTDWEYPDHPATQHQAVAGSWKFRYAFEPNTLTVQSGVFETSTSRGNVSGVLAPRDSTLSLRFEAGSLENYRDFINAIRKVAPGSLESMKPLSGSVGWDGTIQSSLGGDTFHGHLRGEHLRYDGYLADFLEGDIAYSSDEFSFTRGVLRRREMEAGIEASLSLDDWNFLPESTWSADVNLEKADTDVLQQLAGWTYPIHGQLTAQLHGRGTRNDPAVSGLFDLSTGQIRGNSFNRLRGQVILTSTELRLVNSELRFFPPEKDSGRGAGIITGTVGYRFADTHLSAELTGAALPLENVPKLQSPRLPVGGQASFRLKLDGPAGAPSGKGSLRIVDLRIGQVVIGSFDCTLDSDGHSANFDLSSAMSTGEISGRIAVVLSDEYAIEGKVQIKNIELDPFLMAALHLEKFIGHARADGELSARGELAKPESLVLEANLSRLSLDYASVRLENKGPIRFRSSSNSLEIEPAVLQGTQTNLKIAGSVEFTGKRSINLRLSGPLDLMLLNGLSPDLEVRGPAQMDTSFEGTLDHPKIVGQVHISNASLRAADFPTGISNLGGDLVFDANRLYFENLAAEAGGGKLQISGSVSYTESPLRFDLSVKTNRVRVRYPEGMSWLLGGELRLTGTPGGGVLSGRVLIEKVTLTQGLEVASMFAAAKEGVTESSPNSTFLRNLQFDVEAISAPDARMEWPGAELQADANLRVRGTWEHPILLGHIHILSGELYFAGNRYRVNRGDLNFANPFRIDPVLNVEANTTIQQYEITLNFEGTASKLTLAYRSDPPLPANDIITLLALGQTTSEATARSGGTSQSGTAGASAILSEAISSQLGGRLERLFGITRFRVDPGLAAIGSTGAEQNAAARVTVEQRIARNLTITYVSNVSSTQQQVIQVEYNVDKNISIVGLRDQNGTFGIDIKIKKRFD
jgi:translocation and assembly module TamB